MGLNNNKFNTCNKIKIVHKINQETVFFKNLLADTNYMISGSFLISLLLDRKDYSDIDLYFTKHKLYNLAVRKLNNSSNFELLYKTKYASTYKCSSNNTILQLVKSTKKNAYVLAHSHDFANCCMAYDSVTNKLHITSQAIQAWKSNTLLINKTPCLSKRYPITYFYNQFYLLASRVFKYLKRYSLVLHSKTGLALKEVLKIYDTNSSTLNHANNVVAISSYAINIYITPFEYKKLYSDLKDFIANENNMHELRTM